MRVCMIIPPSPFLLDERVFVSLGVLKIASSLEARGHVVEVLDLSGVSNYEEVVRDRVALQPLPDAWGVTVTTPQMPSAARIARIIKGTGLTIAGGPHPTLCAAAAKAGSARGRVAIEQVKELFDVVVAGDGEDAVVQALRSTPGTLIDADDPKGPLFLTSKRLEETPYPARHLVDMESYKYSIDGANATSLIAQLGCPFGCGFCGGRKSSMLRKVRTRSTESILREIELLHREYGYTGFMFYDDELNVNKGMLELMTGLSELQSRLGVDFRLRGFVKAELLTQEQTDAMYAAGFRWLLTGFESGSPRILENINKKATRDDNDRAVEFATNSGLKVKALMSVGHPGESRETIGETQDWLLRVRPADFDVTIITPYPGSPYYDDAVVMNPSDFKSDYLKRFAPPSGHMFCYPDDLTLRLYREPHVWTYTYQKTGDRLHMFEVDYTETADYYKGDPNGGYVSHVFTDYLTPVQIVELRDSVEKIVREKLGIPYPKAHAAIRYEHSMGMGLPSNIFRQK